MQSQSEPHSAVNLGNLADLWPDAYRELRAVAARLLSQERPGHTLAATALVNEAYLRLNANGQPAPVVDRKHFFALAARVMRNVLVDHASARKADKRGAGATHVTLSGAEASAAQQADVVDVLSVHEALALLEQTDPRAAQVTELKVFGGLQIAEIAEALGVSEPTVKRDWIFAKAWLSRQLAQI
jgi:RNA polymerase sigma factor (TIGR02999 family)